MKYLCVIMLVLLSACSSSQKKFYYQLPDADVQTQVSTGLRQLWVAQVIVADHLVSKGIVYQLNDVRYVSASHHLWGSSLEQQLQQMLISNLSAAMPAWLITSRFTGNDQAVLTVTVNGFHGRYDGKAVIRGQWLLRHQQRLITQSFNIELEQDEAGYDALVRKLAEGWQQQVRVIAAQIDRHY